MSRLTIRIESFPKFATLPVGTDVSFKAHIENPEAIPEGTVFRWVCVNDPSTIPWYAPTRAIGPWGVEWKSAEWTIPGRHTIIFTAHFKDGTRQRVAMPQRVDHAASILKQTFDASANDHDPTPSQQLQHIKTYLETLQHIARERPPINEEQREEHEGKVGQLTSYIHHLEDHMSGLHNLEGWAVDAMHIDKNTATRTPLRLWLVNLSLPGSDEKLWRLVDWTNPVYRYTTGTYENDGDTHGEAIQDLIRTWDWNNRYPEGHIQYQFSVPKYGVDLSGDFETDGGSFWDEVSSWLDYAALGAAAVAGVVTLLAPVPGSRVVSAAIWTSIFTSTGAAAINISQRHAEGFGNWKDDAFDGLSIVGNLFAAGGMAWKVGATVTSATKLGTGMQRAVLIGQVSTDGMQGILLAAEHINQYQNIMDDPRLSPDERLQKLMELLRSAAIASAMTYISVKGTTADLNNLNNNRTLLNASQVNDPEVQIDLDTPPPQSIPVEGGQTRANIEAQTEPESLPLRQDGARMTARQIRRAENRFVNPDTLDEAANLLEDARTRLIDGGKPLKYSDDELLDMLDRNPTIRDNYIVRLMNKSHVFDRSDTVRDPNNLTGKLGGTDDLGRVKYWSTTFDQIVDSDSDPDLIRRSVGMGDQYFDPNEKWVMVLIDRKKHEAASIGTSIVPTYDNLTQFALRQAGHDPAKEALIREVMTERYSREYLHYKNMADNVVGKDANNKDIPAYNLKDPKQLDDFIFTTFGSNMHQKNLFNARLEIENSYGAYKEYAGNGLTKSLHDSGPIPQSQNYGVKETFTYETNPKTLQEMLGEDMIAIVDLDLLPEQTK
ncbi:hypothetical protein [Saccharospirillum alexandrii]|uniref:hypothetical protein n=1 Tax=Saccharospirillum alexandrii TaxID=2448477 RepID=UPI003735932E